MLQIEDLSKRFETTGGVFGGRQGSVQALAGVTLELARGETLAVVGGSGCGKTTLAKILCGLVAPDAGRIRWEGQDFLALSRPERARKVGMIFQDPYASLNPKLTVGTQLREVCQRCHPEVVATEGSRRSTSADSSPSAQNDNVQAEALLASVGLSSDALDHYPFQFSGGQRQRIAIARALARQPECLIADEPLSALDVSIQAQILELFRDLKARLGLTLMFITHDLALAASFADRVVVLETGRIVETGPARSTLQNPRHAYTQALAAAIPVLR